MSLLAMPLLVVNLGSEMLYILDQRLKAQKIPVDKSCKVISDVVKTMFDTQFVEKLFVPQEMYTVAQTRRIFDKLAHSSIMKLSEQSMDKLFDLMMMGVKYQILCSTRVEQILEVSMLHLETVQAIIQDLPDEPQSGAAGPMLARVRSLLAATYAQLTPGAWHLLRQTLLRFFQDRRIKVSLFLQEGIQSAQGRIILPSPASTYVGTVTYYDLQGGLERQEKLQVTATKVEPMEFFCHPCTLGDNLYSKTRVKVPPPPRKGTHVLTQSTKLETDYRGTADDAALANFTRLNYSARTDAPALGGELTLLSALLNKPAPQAGDNFRLNLWGEDEHLSESLSPAAKPVAAASGPKPLVFAAAGFTRATHLEGVMKDLGLEEAALGGRGDKGKAGGKRETGDDAEDLLDLMDQVA